jgi:hypothetical protein
MNIVKEMHYKHGFPSQILTRYKKITPLKDKGYRQ